MTRPVVKSHLILAEILEAAVSTYEEADGPLTLIHLLRAYEQVLPRHGLDVANDSHVYRLLLQSSLQNSPETPAQWSAALTAREPSWPSSPVAKLIDVSDSSQKPISVRGQQRAPLRQPPKPLQRRSATFSTASARTSSSHSVHSARRPPPPPAPTPTSASSARLGPPPPAQRRLMLDRRGGVAGVSSPRGREAGFSSPLRPWSDTADDEDLIRSQRSARVRTSPRAHVEAETPEVALRPEALTRIPGGLDRDEKGGRGHALRDRPPPYQAVREVHPWLGSVREAVPNGGAQGASSARRSLPALLVVLARVVTIGRARARCGGQLDACTHPLRCALRAPRLSTPAFDCVGAACSSSSRLRMGRVAPLLSRRESSR